MLGNILLILYFLSILFGFYMLLRTFWVSQVRMKVLNRNDRSSLEKLIEFDQLPSFNFMLYNRFFIWDINKFKEIEALRRSKIKSLKVSGSYDIDLNE